MQGGSRPGTLFCRTPDHLSLCLLAGRFDVSLSIVRQPSSADRFERLGEARRSVACHATVVSMVQKATMCSH